jgi:hypothetical protein
MMRAGRPRGVGEKGGEPRAEHSQDRTVPDELHTDTADWNPPVKLISMVCVRADHDGGGRSRVLDIDTLREEVRARLGSRMREFLALEPAPRLLAPYRGRGSQVSRVGSSWGLRPGSRDGGASGSGSLSAKVG